MSEKSAIHEQGSGEPAIAPADHGHDDHAHAGGTLGPVDVRAWGALAIGAGAGLLVAACLVITTQLLVATPV